MTVASNALLTKNCHFNPRRACVAKIYCTWSARVCVCVCLRLREIWYYRHEAGMSDTNGFSGTSTPIIMWRYSSNGRFRARETGSQDTWPNPSISVAHAYLYIMRHALYAPRVLSFSAFHFKKEAVVATNLVLLFCYLVARSCRKRVVTNRQTDRLTD